MRVNNLFDYLNISAEKYPDKTAFSDEERRFPYVQALEYALKLGNAVSVCCEKIAAPASGGMPVAVLAERNAETPLMLQAILASGNYYVPLDPKMPVSRLERILDRVSPAAVVYSSASVKTVERLKADVRNRFVFVNADNADGDCSSYGESADLNEIARCLQLRRSRITPDDPAYVIFTSGSTGEPKGIVVAHRSVIEFTEWMSSFCGYGTEDVFGNQAPFYFDLSGKDLYQTLSLGASCHIFPKKYFSFPALLLNAMNEKKITAINWATSSFHLTASSGILEKTRPVTLRKAALGGEALLAKHVNAWKKAVPDLQVVNMYGPTEVTIDATAFRLERDYGDGEVIPIGTPVAGKKVMLLDDDLKPVTPGAAGEICVEGGLALGYLGDPEKTAAAFVKIRDPEDSSKTVRIYRTGDMACEKGGNLYFLSRRDGQIKHMGYRIELGEIENTAVGLEGVDAAVCLYDKSAERIVLLYTGSAEEAGLAKAAREALPKYMVPNIYRHLESFPMNANGKIDRALLKNGLAGQNDTGKKDRSADIGTFMKKGVFVNCSLKSIADSGPDCERILCEGAFLLFRQKKNFKLLELFVLPECESLDFSSVTEDPVLCEITVKPGKEEAAARVVGLLKSAGFEEYTQRVRLSCEGGAVIPETDKRKRTAVQCTGELSGRADILVPGSERAGDVLEFLEEHFDRFSGCIPDEKSLAEALDSGRILCLITRGGVSGLLHFSVKGRHWEIRHLAVSAEFRGKGAAAMLLDAAREKTGLTQSLVWTGADNVPALRFYGKQGYKVDGCRSVVLIRK